MEYEYLKNGAGRELYKNNILKIIKYCREKNIDSIILAGASAAPVGTFFREVWKKLYPKEKIPEIYSIEFVDRLLGIKHSYDYFDFKKSEIDKIRKRLFINYPHLAEDIEKKKPLLLLDEHASSGSTLKQRKKLMKKLGAKEVYSAVLTKRDFAKGVDVGVGIYDYMNLPEWYGKRDVSERKKLVQDFKKLAEEIAEETKF